MITILKNRWTWLTLGLLLYLIPSRLGLRSEYLYSWDSVNYALSIEEFNIHRHQPHPPGYLFYSFTIRGLNYLVQDPNLTMILMNLIATLGACLFITLLVLELAPERGMIPAAGAAAIYATNPVSWFYGCLAEIYPLEGFFAACIAYLVLSSYRKPSRLLWASGAMAIAGGFRLTTEVFLIPIYLAGFFRKDWKTISQSIVILALVNLIWIVILVSISGGLEVYLEKLQTQGMRAASKTSMLVDDAPERGPEVQTIVIVMLQAITLPVLLFLLFRFYKIRISRMQLLLFLTAAPALAFYILVHYAKDGYLLLILPVWIALMIASFARIYSNKIVVASVLVFSCLLNGWIFMESPLRPEKRKKKTFQRWLLDEFRSPNHAWIQERNRVLTTFFRMLDRSPEGNFLVLTIANSNPHWRLIMFYRPNDEMLVTRPNARFYPLVFLHRWRLVSPPIEIRKPYLFVIGPKPKIDMDGFTFKRTRHHYSRLENLPKRFTIYGVDFVRGSNRTRRE